MEFGFIINKLLEINYSENQLLIKLITHKINYSENQKLIKS